MTRSVRALVTAAVALAFGAAAVGWWRRPAPSRVQRGWAIAYARGCFDCHGPGGIRGMADPGHGLDEVPPFASGVVAQYAQNEGEIREWILDGLPRRVREDAEQMKLRAGAIIAMPAWRGRLSGRETDDLVAFVKAVSDFDAPREGGAAEGGGVASRLGCFNCHGPQGRGSMPNARSFKGYIPSWEGREFAALARDEGEIREWILDGRPRRLQEDRLARFYLDRQLVQMPRYRGHVAPADVDRIVEYVRWVRQHPY